MCVHGLVLLLALMRVLSVSEFFHVFFFFIAAHWYGGEMTRMRCCTRATEQRADTHRRAHTIRQVTTHIRRPTPAFPLHCTSPLPLSSFASLLFGCVFISHSLFHRVCAPSVHTFHVTDYQMLTNQHQESFFTSFFFVASSALPARLPMPPHSAANSLACHATSFLLSSTFSCCLSLALFGFLSSNVRRWFSSRRSVFSG